MHTFTKSNQTPVGFSASPHFPPLFWDFPRHFLLRFFSNFPFIFISSISTLQTSPCLSMLTMSRPQVSIDRLTPRRATVEPREAMNCKSCRKRKVGRYGPHKHTINHQVP